MHTQSPDGRTVSVTHSHNHQMDVQPQSHTRATPEGHAITQSHLTLLHTNGNMDEFTENLMALIDSTDTKHILKLIEPTTVEQTPKAPSGRAECASVEQTPKAPSEQKECASVEQTPKAPSGREDLLTQMHALIVQQQKNIQTMQKRIDEQTVMIRRHHLSFARHLDALTAKVTGATGEERQAPGENKRKIHSMLLSPSPKRPRSDSFEFDLDEFLPEDVIDTLIN